MSITITLSDKANEWLKSGEQGLSSKSIFSHLTGLNILGDYWSTWGFATPSDPPDLRRCRLLLDAVPEFRDRFQEMRTASRKWAIAVEHWDELCALFDQEAPNWATREIWSAPKTYERMEAIGL